jgi:hypothetical protein
VWNIDQRFMKKTPSCSRILSAPQRHINQED